MRTWIKQEETNEIYTHLGRNNPEEPLIAEIVTVDTQEQFDSLAIPRNQTTKEINDRNESFNCLLYTSPSPRDKRQSRMPSSA